ncbi:L,D-transpeptidase ErfK/SrfK [Tenacibaculum sediminilitoris]|uniref:L,D-transpeptidase n=1 Tax=Tenacibaculum sediminilitoris TaxID=1820334 RepID=UPI0038958E41
MLKIFKITSVLAFLIILKLHFPDDKNIISKEKSIDNKVLLQSTLPVVVKVHNNIIVENYFEYLDSIVKKYDSLVPYMLTEHLLVRSNPWIIDTLQNTDYYRMKAIDSFVYDQKKMIVLPKGALIVIPDSITSKKILDSFQRTSIDINIPEFRLKIYEDSLKLYDFPIRVGKNEEKYLKMSDRVEDLKTKTGKGFIVNHIRKPRYANPVNNFEYLTTKRDDNRITKLPQIPFIETEINGLRYGQMIHPTTNPTTLGKAYSNGCIGTKEADAWVIYYYAPIGTKIEIRYDLEVLDEERNKKYLKNIYKR